MSDNDGTTERETLRLVSTDRPYDALLDTFYQGYDQAFVLPEEKEPLEGFRDCLALNHAPAYVPLASRFGAYREIVFTAVDATTNALVGGGNFIVLSHALSPETAQPPYRTIHLSYIYVLPAHRRRGHLDRMVAMVDRLATEALPSTAGAGSVIFIEQNDPLKMSAAAYAQDTTQTGLDQIERIGIWARRGARVVDIDYVQPALSTDHAPDHALVLCALRPDLSVIDACVVRDHLRAFFAISVLKGADPYGDAIARGQITPLDGQCQAGADIRLLDPTSWAENAGPQWRGDSARTSAAGGLRSALASAGPIENSALK